MDIKIKQKDVSLTLADKTYIWNRLHFALAANHRDVDSAEVSLCPIPGFESEGMHRCRVEIQLLSGEAGVGDSSESDIYVAIDRAVERSCSKISSNIESQWRAFSQSGSAPLNDNGLSTAA